jgi:hypothetical protein
LSEICLLRSREEFNSKTFREHKDTGGIKMLKKLLCKALVVTSLLLPTAALAPSGLLIATEKK